MIYKGSQKQGSVYKGSAKIGKIYKGSQLVYQSISSVKDYTMSISASGWTDTVNINPTIPSGKKFKVTLISQSHGNYILGLLNSDASKSQIIYSKATGENNYNVDLVSQIEYTSFLLANYNAPNNTTVKVRLTIY